MKPASLSNMPFPSATPGRQTGRFLSAPEQAMDVKAMRRMLPTDDLFEGAAGYGEAMDWKAAADWERMEAWASARETAMVEYQQQVEAWNAAQAAGMLQGSGTQAMHGSIPAQGMQQHMQQGMQQGMQQSMQQSMHGTDGMQGIDDMQAAYGPPVRTTTNDSVSSHDSGHGSQSMQGAQVVQG